MVASGLSNAILIRFRCHDVLGRSAQFAYGTTRAAGTVRSRWRRRDAACRTVCYLIAWKLRRLDDLPTHKLDFLDPCFVRTRRALIRTAIRYLRALYPALDEDVSIFYTGKYCIFDFLYIRFDDTRGITSKNWRSFGIRYFLINF